MKKTFELENLHCANCALNMENAIRKIDGVQNASINFITRRMTVKITDAVSFEAVIKKVAAAIKRIDGCAVLELEGVYYG
ncbi:MAG: zinc/cadmium/mercury/lead-transporting ATPase [Firmicutes bacterium ADurb.Bin182]|nr:MAG: zinc/cadmium/mercury/lead-transporting ATPase [Firmicutes bacterium ADurb.Bin182]